MDIIQLTNGLEARFKNVAYGDEKAVILELLSIYYPIVQAQLKTNKELKQSKMNFYNIITDCLHRELKKEKNTKYIYKCVDCNKTMML